MLTWVEKIKDALVRVGAYSPYNDVDAATKNADLLDAFDDFDGALTSLAAPPDHGALSGLTDDDHPQYLKTDGSRALTGDQSAGSHKITNLSAPGSANDAARKTDVDAVATTAAAVDAANLATAEAYADAGDATTLGLALKKDGSVALTGDQSFGSHKATNLATGTNGTDGVNKTQMDAADVVVAAAAIAKSTQTTKGDLLTATGASTPVRHGVPANGKTIIAASGQADGWTDGDHGDFAGLSDDDHTQYILVAGTRPFTGDQSLGSHKLTNVVDPTSAQDGATKKYADKKFRIFKHIGTAPFECRVCCGHCGTGGALTTSSPAIGTLFAIPWRSPAAGTLDRLSFEVTALAAGGAARVGLYTATSETNIYPDALVVDGGDIATTSTGVKDATISTVLDPDKLYWAVYLAGTLACAVRSLNAANVDANVLGWRSTLGSAFGAYLTVAQAYGSLPSTFPAGAAIAASTPPCVWARYSA